jgi:hypothetical protein
MERRNPKTVPPARRPADPFAVDDLWMADLPDDLGCLSLSSDGESRRHDFDEMGCMGPARDDRDKPFREPHTRHADCGI